jgi:hypothetical protein
VSRRCGRRGRLAALDVYGHAEVIGSLSPNMNRCRTFQPCGCCGSSGSSKTPAARTSGPGGAIQHNTDDPRDRRRHPAATTPGNTRAAVTVGNKRDGETTKYFGTDLQVFRLRMADLNRTAPEGHHPPN